MFSSPWPLDSKIEYRLFAALPLDSAQLQKVEEYYNGSLPHWTGALLHISGESRMDLSYAAMRLSGFNSAPKLICFEILHQTMCYLYHHPHIPLMFSSKTPNMETMTSYFYKGEAEIKDIHSYDGLVNSADSDLATDLVDRRSVSGGIHEFNNTAFAWYSTKQMDTATGSNGSEARSLFKCTKGTIRYRRFFDSIGRPLNHPTPTHEDNEATISQVLKDRLTPEVKHLDVIICWLHQQHLNRTFTPIPTSTKHMKADVHTKAHGGETLQRKVLPLMGFPFYPPPGSEHHQLLQLDQFNIGVHRGSFLLPPPPSKQSESTASHDPPSSLPSPTLATVQLLSSTNIPPPSSIDISDAFRPIYLSHRALIDHSLTPRHPSDYEQ